MVKKRKKNKVTKAAIKGMDKKEIIQAALEVRVRKDITENVRVEYNPDANNYKILIWKKGISVGVITRTRVQGIFQWQHVKKKLERYCRDLKNSTSEFDATAHVTLMLLNDMNLNYVLLSIMDGFTYYDFLQNKKD